MVMWWIQSISMESGEQKVMLKMFFCSLECNQFSLCQEGSWEELVMIYKQHAVSFSPR